MNTPHRIDPARWPTLSPLLDALLDLPPAERPARLDALRAEDPALAEDLATLLQGEEALDQGGFMQGGALPPPSGLGGQILGAYTLERELGRGGMGQVWLAHRNDGRYEGQVAVKLLQGGLLRPGDAARFAREGSILARLDQPHIARLLDAGVSTQGQPYLVLEYVDGEPIDRYAERMNLGLEQRLRLLIDAADAVAHAHSRLILHRDLKPSNMLVRKDGVLKLLDFGIAKLLDDSAGELTAQAGAALTPSYAAPEQLLGEDVTTATDVYALGVLLYELLGGGHPTAGNTTATLARMRSAIETEPQRLSDQVRHSGAPDAARRARALQGDIDTIVAQALKKPAQERYANAAELADDLRRALAHEPIRARPDGWLYRSHKFVRRHRLGVALFGLGTAAVLAGAAVAVLEAREARAQRVQAEGLLEFMLGDLRKRLAPVGRLDALDAVGEQALAYYAAQDAAKLDAESLGRRARALHLIGEIAERRGQLDEAARRFEQAARSTAELLAREPGVGQRVFDHAQSVFWVGQTARRRGQLPAAQQAFENYRVLAQQLVQLDPQRADWQLELAYAEQNLGVLQMDRNQWQPALDALLRARSVFERAANGQREGGQTEARRELAGNLGWLTRAHEALGQYAAAREAHGAKVRLLQNSAQSNRSDAYQIAVAQSESARLLLRLGQAEAARPLAQEAVAALERSVAFEPSNMEWQSSLGLAHIGLAEVLAALGDGRDAQQALVQARAVLSPLWSAEKNKDKLHWTVHLPARWLAAAAGLQSTQQPAPQADALRPAMQDVLDRVAGHQAQGRQLDPVQQRQVTALRLAYGDLLQAAGNTAQARQQWQQVAATAPASSSDWHSLALQAHAHQRLQALQLARQLADSLQVSPYRHPLFADLQLRLGHGQP